MLYCQTAAFVWDQNLRYAKLGHKVSPHKSFNISVPNVSQRLGFNPLGEVVCSNQEPPPVTYRFRERPYYFQSLLGKWARTWYWVKNSSRLMDAKSKFLARITTFWKTLGPVFACSTTNNPRWGSYVPETFLQCDFHIFLRLIPPRVH